MDTKNDRRNEQENCSADEVTLMAQRLTGLMRSFNFLTWQVTRVARLDYKVSKTW